MHEVQHTAHYCRVAARERPGAFMFAPPPAHLTNDVGEILPVFGEHTRARQLIHPTHISCHNGMRSASIAPEIQGPV